MSNLSDLRSMSTLLARHAGPLALVLLGCASRPVASNSPVAGGPPGADGSDPGGREVPARSLDVEQLESAVFPLVWRLPEAPTDPALDLLARMRELLAARWEESTPAGSVTRNLGDLVREASACAPEGRGAWLAGLERRLPQAFAQHGPELRALLLDGAVTGPDWDPGRDAPDDGILEGPAWPLRDERERAWSRGRKGVVLQAASLVRADLVALKAAENDYRLYPRHVAADYLEIGPVEDAHFRGVDRAGHAFDAHRMRFRNDLPFPFGSYSCELHVLARVDGQGHLVTDIYSPSPDFHYMGGRDTLLPVHASDGTWVATLDVRRFGLDLDGVPDDEGDRRRALRGSLGNLRREAERLFRASGGIPRLVDGAVPDVRVVGEAEPVAGQ